MLSETKIENMMLPIFPTIASPLPLGYTLNSMSAEVCV
jgi:hypothetical protein